MENKEYRAWFENTRKSNQETIDQTEAIFEGLILKIASGAMAISFSFITALSTKIEYRFLWILAIGYYSCRMYHSKSTITLEGKKKLPNKYI